MPKENTMNAVSKNRKFMWIVGAVLLVIYFYPTLFQLARHATSASPSPTQSRVSIESPVASAAAPPATAATNTPAPPATKADTDEALEGLAGLWRGNATLPVQGMCTIAFDLREDKGQQGHFLGEATLRCIPLTRQPGARANPMIAMLSVTPTSSILTGSVDSGSIRFHVDKTIGEHCNPTQYLLTPFGPSQLAAEWKDPACGDGQMLMSKAR
jgi:hypothetical protein